MAITATVTAACSVADLVLELYWSEIMISVDDEQYNADRDKRVGQPGRSRVSDLIIAAARLADRLRLQFPAFLDSWGPAEVIREFHLRDDDDWLVACDALDESGFDAGWLRWLFSAKRKPGRREVENRERIASGRPPADW